MPFTPEQQQRRLHSIERAFAIASERIVANQPLLLDVYDRGTDGQAHRARLLLDPTARTITLETFSDSTQLPTLLHGIDFIFKLGQEKVDQFSWSDLAINYAAVGEVTGKLTNLKPIRILMTVHPVAKHLVVAHKQDRHLSATQMISEYISFLEKSYAQEKVLFPVCALLLTYRHGQAIDIEPPAKGALAFATQHSTQLNQHLPGFDRIHPGRIKNDLLPSDSAAI